MNRLSNISNILAFVTVAREGSVSKAADALNLTQPAVSNQVKKLSEEMGLTLFVRTTFGLKLTQDGIAVLPRAEKVLNAMKEFQRSADVQSSRISGKLTLGTIIDPEFIRLGRLLANIRSEHPHIQTELMHGVSGNVLKWLRQGRVDAGYFLCQPDEVDNIGTGNDEPIFALKLADFSYSVIAPAGWSTEIEKKDWKGLAKLPWLGTPKTSVHNRLLSKICEENDIDLNIVARVDQESSMLEMVRSGVGLSLCRDSIALHEKQSNGLVVSDKIRVKACLCFIALEHKSNNPILAETIKLVQRSW